MVGKFKKNYTKIFFNTQVGILENIDEQIINLEDVFNISDNAFSSYSYVSRTIHDEGSNQVSLENKISELVKRKKIIILHGYTKQGKTVLIKRIFTTQSPIFLEGGAISSINSIWNEINTQSNIAGNIQKKEGGQQSIGVSSTNSIIGGISMFKQTHQDQNSATATTSADFTETYTLDPKSSAAKILKNTNSCLIIDDFHFLSKDIQTELVQFSKTIAGNCSVILITTSAHVNTLFNTQDELTGRTEYLAFPKWEKKDLRLIATRGFEKLKCTVDESSLNFIIEHSFLSPFLTQDICYELCQKNKVINNSKPIKLELPKNKSVFLKEISTRNSTNVYNNILKTNNHSSKLYETNILNNEKMDIYGLIREAIAKTNFFPKVEVSEIKKIVLSILKDPLKMKNHDSQIPQNLNTMCQEAKKINEKMNQQQGKKSDPPLEYIKNDSENTLIFHDPMLALNLITLTSKYKNIEN